MTTNRALIEKIHELSCDDGLPQEVRDYLAGVCEALDSDRMDPPTPEEGADYTPAFRLGWAAIRSREQ